jgi:hypothetical protein
MSLRWKQSGGLALAGFLLFAAPASGQIRSGTITGTVTDGTGAVVPKVEVVVTNQETNVATTAITTEAGIYTAPYLPAGSYTVTVTTPGFASYRQVDIPLATAQTARVDVVLRVGNIEQAVEVTSAALQLQTNSATVSGAVQSEMIEALPNITQNPLYYAALQPGVVPTNNSLNTTNVASFGIGLVGRRQFSVVEHEAMPPVELGGVHPEMLHGAQAGGAVPSVRQQHASDVGEERLDRQ